MIMDLDWDDREGRPAYAPVLPESATRPRKKRPPKSGTRAFGPPPESGERLHAGYDDGQPRGWV